MSNNGLVHVSAHTRDGHKVSSYERSKPGTGGVSDNSISKEGKKNESGKIELEGTIGNGTCQNPKDAVTIKQSLEQLGYYKFPADVTDKLTADWMDADVNTGISKFQKDNGLPATGKINPRDETHKLMEKKLTENKISSSLVDGAQSLYDKGYKFGEVMADMNANYKDTIESNVVGADNYFHCKAHFNAASKGPTHEKIAEKIGTTKEYVDIPKNMIFKGLTLEAAIQDFKHDESINRTGRERAKSGEYKSASEACKEFIPNGLHKKYW